MIAFIIAIVLSTVLFPIGFVFAMLYPKRDKYLFNIALSIDQLGNVVCGRLFNLTLIYQSSLYKFGNEDETISSVIGKNKQAQTLTILGKILDLVLEIVDKNHSIDAIESDELKK